MSRLIDRDLGRYRKVVKGYVRDNIKKYVSDYELIGKRGEHAVSIPIPMVDLPTIRYGDNQEGVGQGDGEVGDTFGLPKPGEDGSKAGDKSAPHLIEAEFTIEELAEMLGESLELPRLQPKLRNNVIGHTLRYTGQRRTGPESLRMFKPTFKEALKRQIILGTYDFENPIIIPIRDDKRYRSWKVHPTPDTNAVILYIMDISGSMDRKKRELVRATAFWLDIWIRAHYQNVDVRYIAHDARAGEVTEEQFYSLKEAGGTEISSAYYLCNDIIHKQYSPDDWNIYVFHFTDGDNFDHDNDRAIGILIKDLLPDVNLFGYGEVGISYMYYHTTVSSNEDGGKFYKLIKEIDDEKISMALIPDKDGIVKAIQAFLLSTSNKEVKWHHKGRY